VLLQRTFSIRAESPALSCGEAVEHSRVYHNICLHAVPLATSLHWKMERGTLTADVIANVYAAPDACDKDEHEIGLWVLVSFTMSEHMLDPHRVCILC